MSRLAQALLAALLLLFLAALLLSTAARSQPVDVALVLLIDASSSVDSAEWEAQRAGTAAALLDPRVAAAVRAGPHGAVALALVQFADAAPTPRAAIGWRRVVTPADLLAFAGEVATMERHPGAFTSISAGLLAARDLLADCPWEAERRVVDVSGDGINNSGPPVEPARDELVAAGITINALAILAEQEGLAAYMENSVIGGPGAFVEAAHDHSSYREALRRKLVMELF